MALAAGLWTGGPASAQVARVDIDAYDIDGASLLDQPAIEAAVYPFLGPQRSQDDIESARSALEAAYHAKGFQSVVVEIPPQTVNDGIVRLHVLEAPVGRLRVTGADYFSPEDIRRAAPSLREGAVPDLNQAQRELSDLNRLPDRQVTPLLKAGQIPGTLDVELQVDDKLPVHGAFEVDNDHASGTPAVRALATISYGNLWQRGHTLSLTYSAPPADRTASEVYAASYLAPVQGTPWNLLAYGYSSNSNVATLGGANVLGKGYAIGLRALRQLPSLGVYSQSMTFGMDFKHFDQAIGLAGSSLPPVAIDYRPVTLSYTIQNGDDTRGSRLNLSAVAGIRGLGDDSSAFSNNRFKARPDFLRLNLEGSYRTPIGAGFALLTRVNGQISDQPLLSGEQFAVGGQTTVRGYLQSEAVGDDGVFLSYEAITPPVIWKTSLLSDWRFYAFVDGGAVRVQDPLPGQDAITRLYSIGLGARLTLLKDLKAEFGVASPLRDATASHAGKARATFNLKSDF